PAALQTSRDVDRRRPHPLSTRTRSLRRRSAPASAWRRRRLCHCAARARVAAHRRGTMSRDTSFYYSFLVLPPRKRSAIIAVWDFCRAVDDAVDEAPDGTTAHTRLSLWRDELAVLYTSSETPHTPQARALQPYIAEFDLPRRPFDDLIDDVEMDLAHVRYQTFAELADYCRRVASAVGLVCIEIFGYRDAAARSYAVDLGIALQLTNIIRDVAADLRNGRLYLPAEDLA